MGQKNKPKETKKEVAPQEFFELGLADGRKICLQSTQCSVYELAEFYNLNKDLFFSLNQKEKKELTYI